MIFRHTKVYRPARLSTFFIQKHALVVCSPHFLQLPHKLVEQILHHFFTAPCAKPGTVIRCFSLLQQSSEVNAVLTNILQFPAGVDPAQIPITNTLNITWGSATNFLSLEEYA